ncbi:hypothetical protein UFOVP28_47 [uncultured Caudovirales phage]|uniref:Uncharacterized protein n=1 Tax=uncultured Caudovirales phage TaxID=2100421 RepID=A0A6J5KM04_9CAUD|nr:hypothetical protein UFOVP28_47 [uncultured Caudovirales phage]
MAILQSITDIFRTDQLAGLHMFGGDTIKIALYSNANGASLSAATVGYTTTGEITLTGYTAGGTTLAGVQIAGVPGIGYVTWSDPLWALTQSGPIDGALIYNASKSNRAIAVLNFGVARYPVGTAFTVKFPTQDPSQNALIRLA